MSDKNKQFQLVANNDPNQLSAEQQRDTRIGNFVTKAMVAGTGAIVAGGLIHGALSSGSSYNSVASPGPTPKIAELTPEQASRTTAPTPTPLPAGEISALPQMEVPAVAHEGAWGLVEVTDGDVSDPALVKELEADVKHEAEITTGGIIKGDSYGVPVLPENLLGSNHGDIPEAIQADANQIGQQSTLPENPAASGTPS